jgi:hypothetical protein
MAVMMMLVLAAAAAATAAAAAAAAAAGNVRVCLADISSMRFGNLVKRATSRLAMVKLRIVLTVLRCACANVNVDGCIVRSLGFTGYLSQRTSFAAMTGRSRITVRVFAVSLLIMLLLLIMPLLRMLLMLLLIMAFIIFIGVLAEICSFFICTNIKKLIGT